MLAQMRLRTILRNPDLAHSADFWRAVFPDDAEAQALLAKRTATAAAAAAVAAPVEQREVQSDTTEQSPHLDLKATPEQPPQQCDGPRVDDLGCDKNLAVANLLPQPETAEHHHNDAHAEVLSGEDDGDHDGDDNGGDDHDDNEAEGVEQEDQDDVDEDDDEDDDEEASEGDASEASHPLVAAIANPAYRNERLNRAEIARLSARLVFAAQDDEDEEPVSWPRSLTSWRDRVHVLDSGTVSNRPKASPTFTSAANSMTRLQNQQRSKLRPPSTSPFAGRKMSSPSALPTTSVSIEPARQPVASKFRAPTAPPSIDEASSSPPPSPSPSVAESQPPTSPSPATSPAPAGDSPVSPRPDDEQPTRGRSSSNEDIDASDGDDSRNTASKWSLGTPSLSSSLSRSLSLSLSFVFCLASYFLPRIFGIDDWLVGCTGVRNSLTTTRTRESRFAVRIEHGEVRDSIIASSLAAAKQKRVMRKKVCSACHPNFAT